MSNERLLRILVTFDCAGPSEDMLLRVTRVMEFDRLEVTGLYVEDEDLLRAANLPGLREVSLNGHETLLDAGRLAAEIAREANTAREAFETLARGLLRHHLPLTHRFDVARGRLIEALDRAAAACDLVLVTRDLRRSGLRPRPATSFASVARRPAHLLVVNEPWASGTSVVVLGSAQAGIDQAARLAAADRLRLVVALPPGQSPPALPAGAELRHLPHLEEQDIAELCLREDARLLVLPSTAGLDVTELLVNLADRLPCSLLKLA
jgi:hypothetical protein